MFLASQRISEKKAAFMANDSNYYFVLQRGNDVEDDYIT